MKIFLKSRWMCRVMFLFFSLQMTAVFSMQQSPGRPSIIVRNSAEIPPLFDPSKSFTMGKPWSELVPRDVMVTPDNKGIVSSEPGKVRHFKIGGNGWTTIIEHPCVKHPPMIAMAQQEDRSLLIVSAGNYINEEQRLVSEYIVFCNGSCRVEKSNWPIQAIAIDCVGKILGIAGPSFIERVNLHCDNDEKNPVKSNATDKSGVADVSVSPYKKAYFKHNIGKKNWIMDIAMCPEGKSVIVTGNKGGAELVSLRGNDDAKSCCQQFITKDFIKEVCYRTPKKIVYVTHDASVKTIDVKSLLQSTGKEINRADYLFFSSLHDRVAIDVAEYLTIAYWTSNIQVDSRHRIKIHRSNNESVEQFVLEVPSLEARYDYITDLGQYGSGISCLLCVALRGRNVIALGTDGKMHTWSLPEKNGNVDQKNQKKCEKPIGRESIIQEKESPRSVTPRKRGSDSNVMPMPSNNDPVEKHKKVSPRDLIKVKIYPPGHKSKETTPTSSRDSSPRNLPSHKKEKGSLSSGETKESYYTNDEKQEIKIPKDEENKI